MATDLNYSERKYHIIYQITNTINGHIYIGAHSTDNVNDGYMGSGTNIKRAIKKYGKAKFHKEVLFTYDNSYDMFDKEAELVSDSFIMRNDTYNIVVGGRGGYIGTSFYESQRGVKRSLECRRKISEANRKRAVVSDTKLKISESLKKYNKSLTDDDRTKINAQRKECQNRPDVAKKKSDSRLRNIKSGKITFDSISKRCIIDGIEYKSANCAASAIGMSVSGVGKRLRSPKWANWYYL